MNKNKRAQFAIVLTFLGVVLWLGTIFIFSKESPINRATTGSKIKAEEIQIENFESEPGGPLALSASAIRAASIQKKESEDKLTLSRKSKGGYEAERIYASGVLSSEITFNAVGSHWMEELPNGTKIDLEMRIKDNKGKWTNWYKVKRSHHAKGEEKETFSELIFIESGRDIQYRVRLETSNSKATPSLHNLKFTFIDSTQGPRVKKTAFLNKLFNPARAANRPKIISRKEWGCDESLMFWNPEYYPVTALVLHHTAGQDGGNNPAATVRGIYYYHTVTRDWGDIGYNYLIDKYGNIYQGRYGEEGVIGGHVYDEINKINYNKGSIGVSVLGTYMNQGISSKAKQALASLSASLLYDFDLSPVEKNKLQGKEVSIVCSHRDLEPTLCPGDKFYAQIPGIRNQADKIQKSFGVKKTTPLPQLKSAIFPKTNTILLNFDKSLDNVQIKKSQFKVKVGSKTYSILKIRKKGKQLTLILAERIGYKLTPKVSCTSLKTSDHKGAGQAKTVTAKNVIKDSQNLVNFLVSKRSSSNEVKTFNREGKLTSSFWAYRPEFRIGVSVALGDVDGDGEEEIIVGAGQGGGPHVRVFDKNGKYANWDVFAFHPNFKGGIDVACGDVDGDGIDEIGVCQAQEGQAWCKVYKFNKQKTILGEWNAFGNVKCGASIAMGDVDEDGEDEVIVGAGPGGKPQVKVFEANGKPGSTQFFAFHPDFKGGVDVAAGDVDLDGQDEIGVCQKTSGQAWCKVYKYNKTQTIVGEWNAFGNVECGASIDLLDINGDGKDEVIVSSGRGYKPQIKTFKASGKVLDLSFLAFSKKETSGLNVAVKNN